MLYLLSLLLLPLLPCGLLSLPSLPPPLSPGCTFLGRGQFPIWIIVPKYIEYNNRIDAYSFKDHKNTYCLN